MILSIKSGEKVMYFKTLAYIFHQNNILLILIWEGKKKFTFFFFFFYVCSSNIPNVSTSLGAKDNSDGAAASTTSSNSGREFLFGTNLHQRVMVRVFVY